jgi:uncharacterized delta-60 repeat protein
LIKKLLLIPILAFSLSTPGKILAQQGKVDNSFNTLDDGQIGDGFNATVRTLLLQEDGNLIVGGDYLSLNGIPASYLTRLNPDGSIDESFNTGTGFNGKIYASYLQSDGKIIVGGSFTTYNGISAGRLIRLNPDGSYDPSLNTTVGATTGIIHDIAMQSDGKIIIVGSFTKYTNSTVNRVARLLPNGTLDSSFLTGYGSALNITDVKIDSNEKIILTGNFTEFNRTSTNHIVRLNTNGSIDSNFNIGAGFDDDVNAIVLQPDGKIILGGSFTNYNNMSANRIIRLNEDVTKDESFINGSGFTKEGVEVLKINGVGEIMVGGSFTGFYNNVEVNRLVFLNSDGSVKPNFDIGSGPSSNVISTLEFDKDGSWFVGGSFSVFNGQNQGRLAKINNEGEQDIAYLASGIGFDNSVLSILPLSNNKIIVGGNFKKFNNTAASKITCLLGNGSIDPSFNVGNSGANNLIKATALQHDGNIILGGNFTKYNDVTTNKIVRIFSNGEIDNSFYTGEGFDGQIYTLAIQSDQKIIAAGSFTRYNKINAGKIIRLLPDGSKDMNFNIGSGADSTIDAILIQPDGKILVGGHFKTFNGLPFAGLVRLNVDGSIDPSFNILKGFDKYVYAIALQSDQKIIVGGSFLTFDEISKKRIVRLNSDGSIDATFESGTGFSKGDVRTILIQPDGRILVGGVFSGTYKNISSSRLIRLLADGSYDKSFAAPLNNTLYAMNFTEDFKLLIGGNFNSISGISKHRIARLKLCVNTTTWNGISWSNGFPSPGKDIYFKEDYPNLTTTQVCGCNIDQDKTVTLLEKNNLGIDFAYTGSGTLVLENSASLYQNDDDMVNTGIVHVKRKTSPVIRFDLTYWSSPVDKQKLFDFSPETLSDKFYWFDPISGWNTSYAGTANMIPGQGYSIRAPQSFSTTERSIFEGVFKGIPNNGKIEVKLEFADRYYLIGNPYPSAITADAFLIGNSSKIKGALYFWTHNTPPAQTVPGNTTYYYNSDDFVVYNLLGGVATSSSLNGNLSHFILDGTISSGQAFFVKSNVVGSLEFNNSMRVLGNNSTFLKPAIKESTKHRFWLNLSNENIFKQILIGYTDEASNSLDLNYDAELLSSNSTADFYSITENKRLVIQGRGMPFTDNDSILLGYKTAAKCTLKLEIDHQDKFFNDIEIFVVDKTSNVVHNLTESSYQFSSDAGTFNDRFSIIYANKNLGIKTNEKDLNQVLINVSHHIINIESFKETIKKVVIFDISGNQLFQKDMFETKKISIQNLFSSHQVLLVKIDFENGNSISKKVIF